MSKITNDGLTRYGTGCFILPVPLWLQWASNVKGAFWEHNCLLRNDGCFNTRDRNLPWKLF